MSKITYTDKVTLNENPNVADINKVKANDLNEIKNVVNANDDNVGDLSTLNTTDKTSLVNAVNEIAGKNNITTDGSAVKTGRIIDGKDEYIKRIILDSLPNAKPKTYSIGITTSQEITKFELYGKSELNEYIPIPRTTGQNSYINYYINADQTNLKLTIIATMDISRFTGYLEISYINN